MTEVQIRVVVEFPECEGSQGFVLPMSSIALLYRLSEPLCYVVGRFLPSTHSYMCTHCSFTTAYQCKGIRMNRWLESIEKYGGLSTRKLYVPNKVVVTNEG